MEATSTVGSDVKEERTNAHVPPACDPPGPDGWFKASFPDFAQVRPFSPEELSASVRNPCRFSVKLIAVTDRKQTYLNWVSIATVAAAEAFAPNCSSPLDFALLLGQTLRARLGASSTNRPANKTAQLHVSYAEAQFDSIFYPFNFLPLPPPDDDSFFLRLVIHFPSKIDQLPFLHTQIKIVVLP